MLIPHDFLSLLQEMVPEMDQLKARLDDAKRALDKEQLKSSGLENKCASLEEDLKFQLSLLEKELTEVKQRKEIEITEMDGKLQARMSCSAMSWNLD